MNYARYFLLPRFPTLEKVKQVIFIAIYIYIIQTGKVQTYTMDSQRIFLIYPGESDKDALFPRTYLF